MSKSCRMCGEILSHATCPHCGSQYSICDGCDHTEPGRRLPEPVITPKILDTIEDAILIADDDSIGAVWEWIDARRKEVDYE